jgi:hypothetical protein
MKTLLLFVFFLIGYVKAQDLASETIGPSYITTKSVLDDYDYLTALICSPERSREELIEKIKHMLNQRDLIDREIL